MLVRFEIIDIIYKLHWYQEPEDLRWNNLNRH
jgi:hypothetical protein